MAREYQCIPVLQTATICVIIWPGSEIDFRRAGPESAISASSQSPGEQGNPNLLGIQLDRRTNVVLFCGKQFCQWQGGKMEKRGVCACGYGRDWKGSEQVLNDEVKWCH